MCRVCGGGGGGGRGGEKKKKKKKKELSLAKHSHCEPCGVDQTPQQWWSIQSALQPV